MSINTCVVSGTLVDFNGTGVSGAVVKAYAERPFIHTADNSLVVNYEVTTTTDGSGAWSLTLIETTTPNVTLTIAFVYSLGANAYTARQEYTVQIPNSASATFASLIGTQV